MRTSPLVGSVLLIDRQEVTIVSSFLLNIAEVERVKRQHHIASTTGLADRTGLTRKTWGVALATRRPTHQILDALAGLGARPDKVLEKSE